jgi:serine/threonine protein kinase
MELKNRVQSNELQCCYLLYKLTKVMNHAHKDIHNLTPQCIQTLEKILKNLWRVAKDIERLVNYCCNDQWIQKVVMWGNTIEHFVLLAFELELYKTLLQKSIYGQAKTFLCELGTWSNNAKIEEIGIITAMAIHDRQKNLSSLEAQIMSNDHNDDEKDFLAKYLIKRLCMDSNEVNVMDACKVKYDSLKRLKPLYKTSVSNVHKISWLGQKFAEKCYNGPIEQSFQQEASLLARFSHPNIVPFVCYATDDKSCSLIMELMNGDLQSLMHENMHKDKTLDAPFGLLEAMDIMLQIAEGMRYLHQNKVVHRDLKSVNVLIIKYDEYVCAKVADFGLSKTRSSICTYSNLTENVGTTRWMAPELHEHQSPTISSSIESDKILKYPFKVDVYSFGMVCYEILTGHLPFYEITMMMELRQKIKDGLRPKIPKQYPTSLITLLENCFHSNPEIRPSFDEICMQLRHIKCSLLIE